MPFDGKISTDRRYPVTLYDSTMDGVVGVASGSIFVKYAHENDTTFSGMTVGGGDWRELGGGKYTLAMGANEWWTSGLYQVTVSGTDTWKDYNFSVEVYREYPSTMQYAIYTKLPATNIASATDGVYVSGLNSASLSSIVSSGDAAEWNTTDVNVTGITNAALSQIIISGNAANWSGVTNISSLATYAQVQNVSGTLNTHVTNYTSARAGYLDKLNITGTIAGSGDLATVDTNIDTLLTRVPETIGFTSGFINSQVNAMNTDTLTSDALSWYAVSEIRTAITGGGYSLNTDSVGRIGISESGLSDIVTSGNAANWDNSNLTDSNVESIASGIWSWLMSGSVSASGVLKRMLAYSAGDVTHSGSVETYTNVYKDESGATLFTAIVNSSGRTIS